ncbi:amino acid adenylation domain-containing protein [Chitinophaga filiformis]|uniref:Amino acid adenylation domain-containing protein n=2 Tax=Chitinophaga filiformis TaxID=104663 RepID=A0A1G8B7L6_CHIFI|nr:amino acid adenylation domain-containing protein [Chitinophaga filiformis]
MKGTAPGSLTLPASLRQTIRENGRDIVFINSGNREETLSYRELYDTALQYLGGLQQQGIRKGDMAVLQLDDNKAFLLFFWACLLGGIIPVPLSIGTQDDHKQKLWNVWKTLSRPFLVADPAQFAQIGKYAVKEGLSDWLAALQERNVTPALIQAAAIAGEEYDCAPEDVAFIQFSSGSTGTPKGVVLTHGNLYFNTLDISERCKITAADIALSWMPLTHDMGLIGFHLTAMLRGIRQCIIATSLFIRRPLIWPERASAFKASLLYSPNFGYEYLMGALEPGAGAGWDLSPVRLIYNGAEPISINTCRKFQERMQAFGMPADVIAPCYGLAEASVAVSIQEPGNPLVVYSLHRQYLHTGDRVQYVPAASREAVDFVEVGYPITHCAVRICDDGGTPLEDLQVGQILVRGTNVTQGYFNNPEATSAILKEDGWLKTGDLGFMHEGRLVITGRSKNLIIVNGQNYYPQDLERALEDITGLETGRVAAAGTVHTGRDKSGGELLIFALFKGTPAAFVPVVQQITQRLSERFGLLPDKVIAIHRMPKTTSGKIQYFQLVSRYLEGEFDGFLEQLQTVLEAGDKDKGLLQIALDYVSGITGKQVSEADAPLSIGLNSLQMMTLNNHLQQRTGRQMDVAALFELTSFKDLERLAAPVSAETQVISSSFISSCSLSHSQKRMWMQCELQDMWHSFNLSVAAFIKGPLDVAALEKALTKMLERHPVLRAVFRYQQGEPIQEFLPVEVFAITKMQAAPEAISSLTTDFAGQSFGPEKQLCKVLLLELPEREYVLQFTFHHLIFDGWSVGIFMKELNSFYESCRQQQECNLPSLYYYSDHVAWEKQCIEKGLFENARQYWQQELAGYVPELGALRQTKEVQKGQHPGATISLDVPTSLFASLQAFSQQESVTMMMSLFTGLQLLYYKLTGRQDNLFGLETAGRTRTEWEGVIGCFLNTLPVRVRFEEEISFRQLLQLVKQQLLNGYKYQQYPVDLLVEETAADATSALFDLLIVYQNFEHALEIPSLGELQVIPLEIPEQTAIVDLQLEFREYAGGLRANLRYDTRYYDQAFVQFFFEQLCTFLEIAIATPETRVADFSLASPASHTFNAPVIPAAFLPVTAQIKTQDPGSIALICGAQHITYQELVEAFTRRASYLNQLYHISGEDRVGILMNRNEQMIIAMLTIMEAGAAYVPLDITFPASRIQFMLEDSGVKWLITDQELENIPAHIMVLRWNEIEEVAVVGETAIHEHDLAYLLYTSGSTGQPKGVLIEHGAVADYVMTFRTYFDIGRADIVVQQSALTFDTHIEEIYPALCSGAAVLVLPEGGKDIHAMVTAIQKEGATVLSTTPLVISALNELPDLPASLRLLISGGDELKAAYLDRIIGKVPVFNTYGPTESTVCAAYQEVKTLSDAAKIGKPIRNRNIFIVDKNDRLLPVGIVGEIYIGGAGLARGYQRLEKETLARFIHLDGDIAMRVYRTGDRGKWNADGSITFLGRQDDQVKIRGYRIELTEVEKALAGHPGIKALAAKVWGEEANRFIAVYYVCRVEISEDEIREYAVNCLPEYMIPAAFVRIDSLPENANGKTDRKKLPYPLLESGEGTAPVTIEEKALTAAWKEALQLDTVHVTTNFFHAGGNSIKAAKVAGRLREMGYALLRMGDFYLYPTVGKLAARLTQQPSTALQGIIKKEVYPLTNAQRRLWFIHQLGNKPAALNLNWAYRIKGALDLAAFQQALETLIARHDSLRTVFIERDGEPQMMILPSFRLSDWFEQIEESDIDQLIQQEVKRTFDLEYGPLIHVTLTVAAPDVYIFLLNIHHLITDGWSIQVFIRELSLLYRSFKEGTPLSLAPVNFRFHDYALQYDHFLDSFQMQEHRDFWRSELQGEIPALVFPAKEASQVPVTNRYTRVLGKDFISGLEQLVAAEQVSAFIVLQSLLNVLFYKYTGSEDILIATDTAHRPYPQMETAMGYFLHELVIRTAIDSKISFRTMLQAVKQKVIEAFSHQVYPYDLDTLPAGYNRTASPLFNVLLLVQNFDRSDRFELLDSGLEIEQLPISLKDVLVDLQLEFHLKAAGELVLEARYDTAKFDHALIGQLFTHFEVLGNTLLTVPDTLLGATTTGDWQHNWNNTFTDRSPFIPVHRRITEQSVIQPNAIAITCEKIQYTYRQLNEAANQLAHQLIQEGGAPGQCTGLLMNRSAYLPIAILAVLKAGNTYVPMDPEYPVVRLQHMIDETSPRIILTDHDTAIIPPGIAVINCTDSSTYPTHDPECDIREEDIAYIIYTSGSTGIPKGIKISHGALADYVLTFGKAFNITAADRIIQQSSISFDVLIEEIFPVLAAGGGLYVLPAGGRDVDQLTMVMQQQGITLLSTTPYVIGELNKTGLAFPDLRVLISGGEVLHAGHISNLLGKVSIYNTYGPSESTVCATYHKVNSEDDCQWIGRPIANRQVYLLDTDLQQVPPRVKGEIYLGGKGLTTGYVKMTAALQEKFIENPFRKGELLYRTGDYGIVNGQGYLQFAGRMDDQLKIRGYRIEAGEITHVCGTSGLTSEVLITVWKETAQLVMYYTTKDGLPQTGLYDYLSARLPFYMVPSQFIHLQAFPLTVTGKIDRKALSTPQTTVAAEAVPFLTRQEIALADIWKDVLGVTAAGRNDHFFLSGGNSLNGTKLVNKVRQYFSKAVQLRDLFMKPVFHQFAEVIALAAGSTDNGIIQPEEQEYYPVSYAQKRMWILHQLDTQKTAYNISFQTKLEMEVDERLLEECVQLLVNRHESLRTIFPVVQGAPVQKILPADKCVFKLHFSGNSMPVFKLDEWPLLQITIVDKSTVVCTMHHIIADGSTVNMLAKELFTLYNVIEGGLAPLSYQYKEYTIAQQQRMIAGELLPQRDYWYQRFATPVVPLELPGCTKRPAVRSFKGNTQTISLDATQLKQLRETAQQGEVTLFMSLLGIIGAFLYRYTGTEDIVLGVPVSGKTLPEVENVAGLFVNSLPLRLSVEGSATLKDLLAAVRKVAMEAYEHQEYPFDLLVDGLQLNRDLSRSPLFDVMVVMLEETGQTWKHEDYRQVDAGISKFDLNFDLEEYTDHLNIRIQFNADIFSEELMTRFTRYFQQFLEHCLEQPEVPVSSLSYLPLEEQQALSAFNPPFVTNDDPHLFHLLEMQAISRPMETALMFREERISFHAFNARVNQLAHYLIAVYNIQPGTLIGVSLERSAELVIAIWAILRTGAAYVPVDTVYPADRKAYIISDSGISLLLTDTAVDTPKVSCAVCYLDTIALDGYTTENPAIYPREMAPAYAIYTSGTTGKPKGVEISHGALHNLVMWFGEMLYRSSVGMRVLLTASVNFDASVQQLFAPLVYGHTLVIIDEEVRRDLAAYTSVLATGQITITDLTPSFLHVLLTALEQKVVLPPLRYVITGGEALDPALVKRFQALFGNTARLINVYGVTEATVNSTWEWADVNRRKSTIGKPLRNTGIYLLDKDLQPVPVGIPGQICIGGAGVGTAYLNKPELTASRFINTTIDGRHTRIYLTGDTGQWLADGTIEFIGRMDRQIKLRGYRIELGEIESAIQSHPLIQQAYVVVRNEELVAFYQLKTPGDASVITAFVQTQLPQYMVPSRWVQLDAFPVTTSGKINEAALPFDRAEQKTADVAIADPFISQIRTVWKEVLQLDRIGVADNFFLHGGHSLNAMLLAARLSAVLQQEVSLQNVFAFQTIQEQAAHLRKQAATQPQLHVFEEQEHYPLSFEQQKLWIIDQQGGSEAYLMPAVYVIKGSLNIDALEAAFAALVARHEVLRTRFRLVNGMVRQVIAYDPSVKIAIAQEGMATADVLQEMLSLPFNLQEDLLMRMTLLQQAPEQYHLIVVAHHIVTDGWSVGIIMNELTALYHHLLLPLKTRQYKDAVLTQLQWMDTPDAAKAARYWSMQLEAAAGAAIFPYDLIPDVQKQWTGKTSVFELGGDLKELASMHGVSLHAAVLAGTFLLMHAFAAQSQLVLGIPVAGRRQEDMEDQIGFYVNTLPVVLQIKESDTFITLMQKLQDQVREILLYQHYPLEQVVDARRLELYNMLVVFENEDRQEMELQADDIVITPLEVGDETTKYDMTILFREHAGGIRVRIKYRTAVFSDARIAFVKQRLNEIVEIAVQEPWKTTDEIIRLQQHTDPLTVGMIDIPINL